ncbi:TSUP family transporter [Glaciecola sp. 2405UD65-10]|uniref:TSUP family transporter n=1 Tax=Glaciecola sp. 2405UD65-10 TaxID=3397244 RepID=UPI003B5C3296
MLAEIKTTIKAYPIKTALLVTWLSLLIFSGSFTLLLEYGGFTFLGLIGAIFANATGAGGGVVFVPFFNQLALSSQTIVATSFAIQCCGMTAGAITWYRHYQSIKESHNDTQWKGLNKGLQYTVVPAAMGILSAQFLLGEYTDTVQTRLHFYFGLFSVFLALAIYGSIPLLKRQAQKFEFALVDALALCFIAYLGGIITAWLSVGVGEIIAVYLILRGFSINFAIALAVILSAFSVWTAMYYHITVSEAVYWQIVIFAGGGAIAGGIIAKHVVLFFSPIRLKIFFATWILIMGLAALLFP